MTVTTTASEAAIKRKLPRNVIVLGWVSFCTDLATEMLYPIMPLFLTSVLGASPKILGLIDGVAEGISSGLRWIGGALSDRFRQRKPFVVCGYSISALSKPVMGLAAFFGGWPVFFVGRCADRLGKSIRTSARDALIVDSTPAEMRGAAFGIHRAMDSTGAVIGPLAALLILILWPNIPLAWLFFIALVPGLASSLLAFTAVRDVPHESHPDAKPPAILQKFPATLWLFILANFIFSLGNSSDSFLILRTKEIGLGFGAIVLAYALYNAIYALASYPLGSLSDRIGRKPVIIFGWIVYAGVYLGFAAAHSIAAPWMLFASYGLYQAMTEGVTKAMIGDVVSKEQRAGAIGLYYTIAGVGQLIASVLGGAVWNIHLLNGRLMAPFAIGAACSLLAIPVIMLVPVRHSESS
jgi:MFS family permease